MVKSTWVGSQDVVKQMLAVALSAYLSGQALSVSVDDNPTEDACKATIVVIQPPGL
jgi:hypothetical protein